MVQLGVPTAMNDMGSSSMFVAGSKCLSLSFGKARRTRPRDATAVAGAGMWL